jgi:hypothetical protein
MRARSVIAQSAVVACSVALVSAYVYQRAGGELFIASPSDPEAHAREQMPGPKAGRVQWDQWAKQYPRAFQALKEEWRKEAEAEARSRRH